jgi:broad specificity phosphatase PhoE
VSHGDTLQILLALALGLPLGRHRELKPLATAEVRELSLAPQAVLP